MTDDETNISIRASRRFVAWLRRRAAQENLTVSKIGMVLIKAWIDRGSPVVTDGMVIEPLIWSPEVEWEKMPKPRLKTSEPPAAPALSQRRRAHVVS